MTETQLATAIIERMRKLGCGAPATYTSDPARDALYVTSQGRVIAITAFEAMALGPEAQAAFVDASARHLMGLEATQHAPT